MASRRVTNPDDLGRLFVERGNSGDLEGMVELYEADAILSLPDGRTARGRASIREFYAGLLSTGARFGGSQRPSLVNGDLALTSTRFSNGKGTAEIARRQADGSWLWVVDQPEILP